MQAQTLNRSRPKGGLAYGIPRKAENCRPPADDRKEPRTVPRDSTVKMGYSTSFSSAAFPSLDDVNRITNKTKQHFIVIIVEVQHALDFKLHHMLNVLLLRHENQLQVTMSEGTVTSRV